ncbi:MAG: hypothetical protein AMK75_06855 [Planctomycetes bacterium SM23_65]|nr:MAG: hypothetical protein AMK75_06855 [Planctomycetes bacterium SM23_65]
MRALAIVVAIAIVALASAASAETFVWYFGVGNGDFTDSPPVFTGGMDPGGDITDGYWSISIHDDGWPLDPVERYAYIWDNFYAPNYTPGTPGFWKGYFDTEHGLPAMNDLFIDDVTNGGTMIGICTIEIQVQDLNNNEVLDEGEFCEGSLTGLVIIIREGTGAYDGMCGTGNYFGSYVKDCPDTYETWNFGMYLWLDDCSTPVQETTWGAIKALYQ